ncbi:MAG: cation-translocating P-type ATPase [Anaerovoracaceae bacterium]
MYQTHTKEQVLTELSSDMKNGLSAKEAESRLLVYGRNEFLEEKKKTRLSMFFSQMRDPMIYILFGATFLSAILKEVGDSIIIIAIIILNSIIGMVQENKAEVAMEALKKISSPSALVKRDGRLMEIDAGLLVQGDIVILEAGRRVPADLRLIETVHLKIDESLLTGESVPSEKDADFVLSESKEGMDRLNMAFMSTSCVYGRGQGVVVATGMETEVGKIAAILGMQETQRTPLQKRLYELGKFLGILALFACGVFFLTGILQGRDVFTMLLTSIALAVAVIPEGLPAIITIVLALGVQRMVKINTIVRKLPAVETLGAVTIVCSDKTGTLTQNKMTVMRTFGEEDTLIKGMVLCNDGIIRDGESFGDPTETALLVYGEKNGIYKEELESQLRRINEKSFDSVRKMMTTVHENKDGDIISFTKGATDQILKYCSHYVIGTETFPLTDREKEKILEQASSMAKDALRVLALSYKLRDYNAQEEDMVFVGLMGMIDPPRPEAKEAIRLFTEAGVKTVMITGDHKDTALSIGKQLGLIDDEGMCMTGDELGALSQEELNDVIMDYKIFARVSPSHKVTIVKAFQSRGHIVSMTGDGVNDAPSLKVADIGVAMGISGTDVAKGASDMILTDDNFATIEKAIEEGRNIYGNIKKAVLFLLSSNFGEILTMFTAIILGLAAPLRAVHILWTNLITDSLPALALGVDPKNSHLMKEEPRDPNESIFANGGYILTLTFGAVIAAVTLTAFLIAPTGDILKAQTYAFTVLAVSQLFNAVGMRDINKSVFKMNHKENPMMIVAFFTGLLLQILVTEAGFLNGIFETVHLTFTEWAMLFCLSMGPLVAHELLVIKKGVINHGKKRR